MPTEDRLTTLAGRIFEANLAAYETATMYLGERLGLYQALRDAGALNARELATATATDERYVREWLEQQAVAGILDADAEPDAHARRYTLPPEHAIVLLDEAGPDYLGAFPRFTIGTLSGLPRVVEAFRSGAGIPYPAYGPDAREGQAALNRPLFTHLLAQEWLPAVPGLVDRIRAGAVVADIGCGLGWSSIALAQAFPNVEVHGFDLDEASIDVARRNAKEAAVDTRVRFEVRDAADAEFHGRYDLVTVFEAIHDMADPVSALVTVRRLMAEDGIAVIADEKVDHEFSAPNDRERLYYAWSVLFCLPTGRADEPGRAVGTVLRPPTLEALAQEAGFRSVETVPVEDELWRLYQLVA